MSGAGKFAAVPHAPDAGSAALEPPAPESSGAAVAPSAAKLNSAAVTLQVCGVNIHAATGGRRHAAGQPAAVFVHGAGFDHSAWSLQSRWLAFHGWNVLALDLPGHGRSGGAPLASIADLAGFLVEVLDAADLPCATLVGHSMGSLASLEAAARAPARVERLVLIGTAASMPVHAELLDAAKDNRHDAIDRVNLWGHGPRAGLGGSRVPGAWMTGIGERILERAAPGVLHADLAACAAYTGALAAASAVRSPTLVLQGSRDQMTPLRSARELAAAIAGAQLVGIEGAGHMLMAERPDEVRRALAAHLAVGATRAPVGIDHAH